MVDEAQVAIELGREALLLTLMIALPLLTVGLVVGVGVSILQSATSVQEQTLTFIPKIFAVVMTLLMILHWIVSVMMDYTIRLFVTMPDLFGG